MTVRTSAGNIVIQLRSDVAPRSVDIIKRVVADGLYNGCCFYRAEPAFVLQGGLKDAKTGATRDNPYLPIPLEYNDKLRNKRGTVTLARLVETYCIHVGANIQST